MGLRTDLSQLFMKPDRDPNALMIDMRDDNEPLVTPRKSNVSSAYKEILSSRSPLRNPETETDCGMAAASGSITRAKRRGGTWRIPLCREKTSEYDPLICMVAFGAEYSNLTSNHYFKKNGGEYILS